jgi:NAD-dependent dihydropyrimidine dehydrogenase PreA subunit
MVASINERECVGCGVCIEACPEGAIKVDEVAKVNPKLCTGCAACVDECPNGAISVE